MSDNLLRLFPAWKQAIEDFLAEFKYGDLVSHDWLEARFGMPPLAEVGSMKPEEYRERQWQWVSSMDAFKSELLRDHQVCLQSVRGKGYRWVPPHEQTGFASKEFEKDAAKVFRAAGQRLRNVRLSELTDEQRKENLDAGAKLVALRGMTRKQLRAG